MLTGSTTKEESRNISSRLTAQAAGTIRGEQEIKLVYVTVGPDTLLEWPLIDRPCQPERIAKSKVFMSLLTKLANGQQLGDHSLFPRRDSIATNHLRSAYRHR